MQTMARRLPRHHRGLHPLALHAVEAAVMDADGQRVVIGEPQVVKEDLGLRAGVVKDERGAVAAHLRQHLGDGMRRTTAGPGGRRVRLEHGDIRLGPGIGVQHRAGRAARPEKPRQRGRILDRGRETHAAHPGAERLQPRQREHELIAALALGEGVDLVHHNTL